VALFVGAALLHRWFEAKLDAVRRGEVSSLGVALLRQVDGFARASFFIAFGYAALSIVGLIIPLTAFARALAFTIGDTPISLFNVIKAVMLLGGAVLISRVLRTTLDHAVYPTVGVEVGAGYAISTAAHYAILTGAFGGALITIGIDLAAMAVFAGALGVGIGFGLQDIARNLISGFILLFGRSVEKGDWITVSNNLFGRVETVGARSVLLRTPDNFDMVIPSNDLVNSTIINWTHDDAHVRVHIPVGTSYRCDPKDVREALLEAAARSPHIVHERPVSVWLTNFGDSAVEFELLLWIDASKISPARLRGETLFLVWDVLKERGIEIPFPQQDLHLRTVGSLNEAQIARAVQVLAGEAPSAAASPPADSPATPEPAEGDASGGAETSDEGDTDDEPGAGSSRGDAATA
jgi:small-conductance mechanosensitive channel